MVVSVKFHQSLSKEQEDATLKELDYSREQLSQDSKAIRTWLNDQEHLPGCRKKESESFINHFLVGCKGSLEKSKQKLDAYYTAKSRSSVYENRDPLSDEIVKTKEYAYILPWAMANGTRIVFGKIGKDFNGDLMSFCKQTLNMIDIALRMDEVSSCSMISIIDLNGISAEIVPKMNPALSREMMNIIKLAIPARTKKHFLINCPSFAEVAFNFGIKPFLTQKQRERFIVTSSGMEALRDYLPSSVLPSDLGGDQAQSLADIKASWDEAIVANRQSILNEWSEKTDETKRPAALKNDYSSDFGLHGSIKRLCLD